MMYATASVIYPSLFGYAAVRLSVVGLPACLPIQGLEDEAGMVPTDIALLRDHIALLLTHQVRLALGTWKAGG
jgi:hypothetical protein